MIPKTRVFLLVLVFGCAKSEADRLKDVRACGDIGATAEGIAECLVARHGWDREEAVAVAQVRQRELDSIQTWLEDSAWNADSLEHRRAVRECQSGARSGEFGASETCLELRFGWEERRAVATVDSFWARDAARHRREVSECARRGLAGSASCLMLRYAWPRNRAQAVYDSLLRASSR